MNSQPSDPRVGTRMKISLPRPKDFINFKHCDGERKGNERRDSERERVRKEKEVSWKARREEL